MNICFEDYHIGKLDTKDSKKLYWLIQNNLKRLNDTFTGTVFKTEIMKIIIKFVKYAIEKKDFEKEGFIRQDYKIASGEIVDLLY